ALVLDGRPIAIGEAREVVIGIEDVLIETDGSFAEALMVRAPGTANGPWWSDAAEPRLQYGAMLGRNLILHAVRKMSDAALRLIEGNGIAVADIAAVIPHQANLNLLRAVGKRLGIPEEKIAVNLDRYGNTSGASAFLALWQAVREGRLRPDSYVLIVAFGAGFTWGAALCRCSRAA